MGRFTHGRLGVFPGENGLVSVVESSTERTVLLQCHHKGCPVGNRKAQSKADILQSLIPILLRHIRIHKGRMRVRDLPETLRQDAVLIRGYEEQFIDLVYPRAAEKRGDTIHEMVWPDIHACHMTSATEALANDARLSPSNCLHVVLTRKGESTLLEHELKETNKVTEKSQESKLDIPAFDPDDPNWVSSAIAAKLEGLTVSTLARYRRECKGGTVAPNKMSGEDRFGRVWGRSGTKKSNVRYLKRTLLSSRK